MANPIFRLDGGWEAYMLRLFIDQGSIDFRRGTERMRLVFFNPTPKTALIEILEGVDVLEVFDRDQEDGFHRDFGRYRVEYFVDDPFHLDADRFEIDEPT